MYLSIATTHQPATDLGYLLMKHPDRPHEIELAFGKAQVFFPEADETRCEATLALEVDPIGLVRGRGGGEGLMDQYVNDRPYAASSFLSVALNRAFRTAMSGASRERPELAATPLPLEIVVAPLPGAETAARLFAPLGWSVELREIRGVQGPSRYRELRLTGEMRLADALSHLYVLIPVTDNDKHYYVGEDEVEKLLAKGGAWLPRHPEREFIARRYLKRRTRLVAAALRRLDVAEAEEDPPTSEDAYEAPLSLHDLRLDWVAERLRAAGVASVADLGCGEGRLLQRLARIGALTRILGLDPSALALERASRRLRLDVAGGPERERLQLLHGALTYRDARWSGVDAAVLVEVIEHLDPDRLPVAMKVVFAAAKPKLVIVTTPNAEYNALFPGLKPGALRHPDHRFEWTRAEFSAWADGIASAFGYRVEMHGLGPEDARLGPPSQAAVFTR